MSDFEIEAKARELVLLLNGLTFAQAIRVLDEAVEQVSNIVIDIKPETVQ